MISKNLQQALRVYGFDKLSEEMRRAEGDTVKLDTVEDCVKSAAVGIIIDEEELTAIYTGLASLDELGKGQR